jgi:hypothetical protein
MLSWLKNCCYSSVAQLFSYPLPPSPAPPPPTFILHERFCFSIGLLNNPCWDKPCHSFASCKLINGTEAVCVCPQNCTSSRRPVCGTNWKTYDNLCSLMAESCAMNDWNSLRYNGECKLMSFWPFWPFLRMVTLGLRIDT